jgi:molecular chaperone DnaK
MVKDAEAHSAEDHKKREMVDVRNRADALIHSVDKSLKELGDKISADDRKPTETAVEQLKSAMRNDDVAAMQKAMEELQREFEKVAEAAYKRAGAAGGQPGSAQGATGGAADEKKVDPDYKVYDGEEKK